MEQGNEWCSLAAKGDIGAAEIGDAVDAGAFGDDSRIADLQRERAICIRPVTQSLPVTADGPNLRRTYVRRAE